ncbi:hypothetical protein LJG69_18155 [Pseudomonas aeruginosa]|uniref:hypothetical protein n=1 Tax=Pseudomonas aeruginosa TaxID=287 RepID=UPI0011C0E411|nr:hypothetical protein [Pseudomonas aeruginosa]MCC0301161.1 hypothetical protein [Pseudomonas aeruginosa]MCC0408560.1 hypothetical protein [Pseudomonas aeruginosa]MCC0433702.1 hypothetical protein [Pseudomonas aeruginosa]NQC65645.1 hypothetical protein [Pseudomonas aeruginosa]
MISNTNPESASATQAIRHSPINPVRADVVGEAVTMEQGASLVDRLLPFDLDECELVSPLAHMLSVPLNQRDAEVAASFVRWLGTNNGRGYLHESQALVAKHRSNAFLIAWTLENRRFQGSRTIEQVLAPPRTIVTAPASLERLRVGDLVITDAGCEVIENIAEWLGSSKGQLFLKEVEREIVSRLKKQRVDVHVKGTTDE